MLSDLAVLAMLAMAVLTESTANALARTASVSGNWNNTATWGGSSVPVAGDTVTINSGITVTVTAAAACTSITFPAGNNTTININSGISLTVSGAVSLPRPNNSRTNLINVGAGTFSAGSVVLSGSTGTRYSQINITTGNVTVTGNITSAGVASQIVFSGAGTLNAGGTFMSGTAGMFTASAGTVNFNAGGNQTIAPFAYTFNNVTLSNSGAKTLTNATISGNLTLSGAVTVTTAANTAVGGNLNIGNGTSFTIAANFTLGVTGATTCSGILTLAGTGAKTFTSDVTINNTGVWNETGIANFVFSGNLQNDGSFTASTGIHTFNGAGHTISGGSVISIPNATINNTYTNNGTLTVGAILAGSSTLTQGTGATLNIGGTSTITGLTANANPNTVNYNGAAQTVQVVAYDNLTLSGSGAKTMTGITTIGGDLTLGGTVNAATAADMTVGGNLDVGSGTGFTVAANFILNVTGTTTCGGTLTLAGNGAQTFNNDLTINNGGILTGGAGPVGITGALSNSGTFNAGAGTITAGSLTNSNDFNASGILNVTGTLLNSAGTFTGGTGAINAADLTNNSTFNTNSAAVNVSGNFLNSAGTFTGNASTITVNGNWTGGGTFTPGTSTVVFAGAGTTTINGSNSFNNFRCTTLSKSILVQQGTTQTVGGLFTINGSAVGTRISLASTGGTPTTWNLVLNGSYACQYVAVQGSNASGTVSFPINPVGSQDNWDNTNWFNPSFQVSGTVYTDEAKTVPIGAGKKVSTSINGAAVITVTTNSQGRFVATANAAIGANNVILAYLDAETEKASLVTISDGVTNFTGANQLKLVTGKIILEHQTAGPITNTNLDVIDAVSATDDDGITIAGGNATFIAGRELWVSSGKTYNPGGTVTADSANFAGNFTQGTFALTVTNNVRSGGTFTAGAAVAVGGFSNTGTFTANGVTITDGGNWANTGTFTAGTSTVVFGNAGATTTITGDTTFNNVTCSTASKSIVVTQGTTQTVGGLLTINGSAFATRVSLASSGGVGTTWNLVLNGSYDCRYVAVRGSTTSGTAYYLPINPVGFKDNGDNTNWYDPNLPAEMVFYDNFETSTLAAAPPNKASSNWTIAGASWLTQASTTVNTQNHTSGGTKSAYSSGGAAGQGIGLWNSPGWGPQINCTAEAWFYDDMQNPKKQWCFIDNAAGAQGVGVMIDTTRSTTKYVYCIYIGGDNRYISYIDRALGWHKVQWVYTASGNVELYLDGALLATTSGLSDFSDYDTGTWNWDNTAGSSAMWFDDFMVYRSQNQSRYRWYENDSAQSPTPVLVGGSPVAENTAITARNVGTVTRLRLQVQNNQFETWSGAHVTLQYRKGTSGTWDTLSPSEDWNYADGLGTDKAQVANALLTNTNVREQFVESVPSAANLALTTAQYGEWDFCVNSTGSATLGTVYYFRLVVTDSAGVYQRSLAAYDYSPQCTLVSPTMTQWTGGTDTNWNNAANWTNGVPDATKDAIIATTATRDCSLNISGAMCKSLVVQSGRILTLGTASTSLTVTQDITVFGTVTHSGSTAVLNLNGGNLRIDTTGRYNHSGNGALNASTTTIQVINGGQYNVSGAPTIAAQTLNIAVGGLVNVTGAATFNLTDFTTELNSQWTSTNTANTVNVSNNFTNDGSMLGSAGGIFNLTKASGAMAGASTTTTFYQLNINGGITSTITNDVRVLNNFSISSTKFFTASSGNLYVGGNWTNSGTFTAGSGTVILNGSALQSVTSGGSNFNRLTVTNASVAGVSFADSSTTAYFTNTTTNSLMTFASGRTYKITATGGMNFQGASGQLVKLRSSTPGSVWLINPSGGSWTANYLDVQDSVNIVQQTILPGGPSTDSGNNTNWFATDANRDSNNDEIPDWWEYSYYGSLTGLNAGTDSDGDGVNNLLEYVLGSDPTSAASPTVVYVDDNGGYNGVGTAGNPYKYLDDALTAATDGQMVKLAEGTYQLSNYSLNKRVLVKGLSARKSIIKGPAALGGSGTDGQMLDFTGANFAMSDLTVRLYKDNQPVITYNNNGSGMQLYQNMIFKDNSISARSIIAPKGSQTSMKVLIANDLFYNNTAGAAIELQANPCNAVNNTVVNNTAVGFLYSGAGNSNITNNIVRGNTTQISNTGSGTLAVTYSNVEGGYTGTGNITGAPIYMNAANGIFRLPITSPGYNYGTATYDVYDQNNTSRVTPVLGAYETPLLDYDDDGRTNAQETSAVPPTNPNNPDSDNDGLYDGEEVTYGTKPMTPDTDGDLVKDGDEPPIGMNPAVFDGQILIGIYAESFEDPSQYPVTPVAVGGTGPWSGTLWGGINPVTLRPKTKYYGNIEVQYVGAPPAAYNGNKIINLKGQIFPRSCNISFIENNGLTEWWISAAFIFPWKRLPTDYNEACCIGGAFFRLNENGNFCVYDGSTENWRVSSTVIPDGTWANIFVERNADSTCNLWMPVVSTLVPVFANIPIAGPDPNNFIRVSFSSASEYDVKVDMMVGYRFPPF